MKIHKQKQIYGFDCNFDPRLRLIALSTEIPRLFACDHAGWPLYGFNYDRVVRFIYNIAGWSMMHAVAYMCHSMPF